MNIISLSNYVPEHITDVVRFVGFFGERNISHFCGYASDFISCVNNDTQFDGAVFPKTCDSCRILKSYINKNDKFVHQINVPISSDESSVSYYAKELLNYKEHLEKHFNISISESSIKDRIRRINKRNEEIKKLYDKLENVSYYDYLTNIHSALRKPLLEQVVGDISLIDKKSFKRGYLVGSFLCNTEVVRIIENAGINVVGDNLPESGRIAFSKQVSCDGDIYYNIAESILNANRMSPSMSDFRRIINDNILEIKNKKVDCVIFLVQKYCEPYEYLYSVYTKELRKCGIPFLKIVLTDTTDIQKVDLMIGAFYSSI